MAQGDKLHPLQQKFLEMAALQCGICTPGILVAAKALLEKNPDPTEDEVRFWLAGNLCRCTGYDKIVRAVLDAAAEMRGNEPEHAMNVVTDNKWIGKRTIRPDGADKVTGRAAYRRRHHHARHDLGQGAAQPASACAHQVDRHREGRGAARREGGGHRASDIVDFPVDKAVDARHPGHALDVPQRDGAREGAVRRPPGRGGRRDSARRSRPRPAS